MKKSDLKQLIKPLVKECIHEVLLEEGLLSSVVSEVARGLHSNVVMETKSIPAAPALKQQAKQSRQQLQTHRKKLMEAVGSDAYAGVDLFEGTEPMHQSEPQQDHADLGDPRDVGVDISSIFGNASRIWQAMK